MHILDLTCIYPHAAVDSEGRSVAALDRALVKAGAAVTTVVLKPWLPISLAQRLPTYHHLAVRQSCGEDQGVRLHVTRYPHLPRIPLRSRPALNVRLMTWRALSRDRWRDRGVDMVHGQGLVPGLAAYRIGRELGIPAAVTLRDDLTHLHQSDDDSLGDSYREMLGGVAALFAIGPAQMRDAPRFLPPAGGPHLRLAPNGVDVEELEQIVGRFPPRVRQADDKARIVSVCNLYRWKGVHENLRALRLLLDRGLDGWSYVVVGDGPYRTELDALSAELGLSEFVRFAGRLHHEQALKQIRDADIFCLPSWLESFGNVFAEAAVCGLPAIGCRGQGPELIITHGETGLLVPPRDSEAVAATLERLLLQPAERRRMGHAARQHVKELTWERTAQIYLETLAAVA